VPFEKVTDADLPLGEVFALVVVKEIDVVPLPAEVGFIDNQVGMPLELQVPLAVRLADAELPDDEAKAMLLGETLMDAGAAAVVNV
jgi:hypothetical protein